MDEYSTIDAFDLNEFVHRQQVHWHFFDSAHTLDGCPKFIRLLLRKSAAEFDLHATNARSHSRISATSQT